MATKSGQAAPTAKKYDVNIMEQIAKHTKSIEALLKEHLAKTKADQIAHTRGKLKNEVWACNGFLAQCIREGKLKHDPTGLITATSDFDDPVNLLCKEWLAAYSKDNPNAIVDETAKLWMKNAEGGGIIASFVYYTKAGVKFIFDAAKRVLTFIWNGVKKVYNWVKGMLIGIWDWFCEKWQNFKDWYNKDKTHKPIAEPLDLNKTLEEGEVSLENNKPKPEPEPVIKAAPAQKQVVKSNEPLDAATA